MKDLASVLADLRREHIPAASEKWGDKSIDLLRYYTDLVTLDGVRPQAAAEKWVEKWDNVDKLLPELVSLAGIRPEAYRGFCLAVHDRLRYVHDNNRSLLCDAAMLKAERRLRSAQDAIVALSREQRNRIGLGMDESNQITWTRHIPKMLESIAKLTGSGPYRPNDASNPGPKRERSHWPLRKLARDLWRIAQAHGGDFTLWADDRGGARGTIVEALHLLKPVLPPGVVQDRIPRTTLNRLRPDRHCAK